MDMTESQREIAGAIQIDPESSLSYNLSFSLHMRGTFDRHALEAALQAVVARHDSLRAGYDPLAVHGDDPSGRRRVLRRHWICVA